jgi:putative SOS response-associated peptidase YedK
MCGRYSQLRSWSELVDLYRITQRTTPLIVSACYNVAALQCGPVVRRGRDAAARGLGMVRWGLVPFWVKDPKASPSLINARAETVDTKPSFREAFKMRRCLVVADGFYEWMRIGDGKQPYFITVAGDRPFAFAGLWESGTNPAGARIDSCTIIVTEANAMLRPIHDRMPVILDPERFDAWLDTGRPIAETKAVLKPFAGEMTLFPVSRRVNSVRNDDPECREPVGPALTGSGMSPLNGLGP